ncbi:MAG: hypothetical protein HKP09_07650 [Enterobacterales bacterium]|nr:hypothetical protein [Enterobacterales bacterium]
MLLRRITEHVKSQNWIAVAIDFFIVVVGVFIGIQVSNWNEIRQEEQKTQTYLERIREDLADNKRDFIERREYFNQVRQHAIAAIAALNSAETDLGEQFILDAYQASQFLPRELGRDTYDEVLSVGALNTESNQAVRKRLSIFYRSITAQQANFLAPVPYRDSIRGIIAYDVQQAIRDRCGDISSLGPNGEPIIALPESCVAGITQAQITRAVTAIKTAKIEQALNHRIAQLDIMLRGINQVIYRAGQIDSYLENEVLSQK